MAGIGAFPALIDTRRANTPVLATAHQTDDLLSHTPPLDQPPIGGIDDLQQQAHRAHADTALQLATQEAHGQLTTPDKQSAFLAERLTHARGRSSMPPPPTTRPAPQSLVFALTLAAEDPNAEARGRPQAS